MGKRYLVSDTQLARIITLAKENNFVDLEKLIRKEIAGNQFVGNTENTLLSDIEQVVLMKRLH